MSFDHLFIGDVHARPDDLADCEALMNGVVSTLDVHPEVREVWLLGDLHHTHAWTHVDVQAFWLKWMHKLSERLRVNVIVGNHDMAPSGNHAMQWFETIDGVSVYDEPATCSDFDVLPYMSKDAFIEAAGGNNVEDVLLCHQTFAGAHFENGFYAPEGVSAADLPYKTVISGHIHEPQVLEAGEKEVIYLGSPRWIGLNDANSERFIYLGIRTDDGIELEKIPTAQWCQKIVRVELTPDSPLPFPLESRWTYHFDLRGPRAWCEENAAKYSQYGKIRTFPESSGVVHVRESEGVYEAFRKFVDNYAPKVTPLGILKTMVQERFSHG